MMLAKEFSMNDRSSLDAEQLRKIREDLLDSIDEELEMSLEDGEDENSPHASPEEKQARATYFRELLRLQGELVKLQDWVVATKQKVVILFEGRDAAGKGGVIKRITQRLNPRVCRVTALPAPNDRERSGTFSATQRICLRLAKLCCSTEVGTTALGSSG
jgi:polyphosphate kinase 2 (PPK2 family)